MIRNTEQRSYRHVASPLDHHWLYSVCWFALLVSPSFKSIFIISNTLTSFYMYIWICMCALVWLQVWRIINPPQNVASLHDDKSVSMVCDSDFFERHKKRKVANIVVLHSQTHKNGNIHTHKHTHIIHLTWLGVATLAKNIANGCQQFARFPAARRPYPSACVLHFLAPHVVDVGIRADFGQITENNKNSNEYASWSIQRRSSWSRRWRRNFSLRCAVLFL